MADNLANTSPMNEESRNLGIDLLRVVAMLMVTTLHVLGHGGVLSNTKIYSANYEVAWALETISYCAVDVYVMITGFVYANKQVRLSKIILLWCTVFFYSATIPIILRLAGYSVQMKNIVSGFFPVLRSQYWFFNAYFALFFFIPSLNALLSNKELLQKTLILSFFLFSFLPILGLGSDLFRTNSGSSFLWFVVLYLCGGYLKSYGHPTFISLRKSRIIFWCSCLLMLLSRNVLSVASQAILGTPHGGLFYSYCSPFVSMCAFCLVVIFSEKHVPQKMCNSITLISSLTFGVYLIHDNQNFRAQIIKNSLKDYATMPIHALFIRVVLTIVTIFASCIFVEYLRSHLFRLLHISKVSSKFDTIIHERVLSKIHI